MTPFPPPVIVELDRPGAPLVVLLHGRGSDANEIMQLAHHLPKSYAYVALRAPIAEGGGFAWFQNRGIGRPVAESLVATMAWFTDWLSDYCDAARPIYLVGYSGGATFAGGLLLSKPTRFAGTAILHGTLPFNAGLATTPGQLTGTQIFHSSGRGDAVIPRSLLDRTWNYLTAESSATVVGYRDDAGHELTKATIDALTDWLSKQETSTSNDAGIARYPD